MIMAATAKSKRKRITFTMGERKRMLDDFDARDYEDLVAKAVEEIQRSIHLKRYGSRKKFVLSICSKTVKPSLVQCIMEMIARYLEIYKACMRGKKYVVFKQQWFQYIHEYMKEDSEQSKLWKSVLSVQSRLLQMIWISI